MAKGLFLLNDGTLKPVEPEAAVSAYKALTGVTEPTEAQEQFLIHIKRIFIPPSYRHMVEGYEAIESPFVGDRTKHGVVFSPLNDPKEPPRPEDKLTNKGTAQSSYDAIPTGDR